VESANNDDNNDRIEQTQQQEQQIPSVEFDELVRADQIDESLEGCFIRNFRYLPVEFRPENWMKRFPRGHFLLRRQMIEKWNALKKAQQMYERKEKKSVGCDMVLRGPGGIGKSYFCYFLAAMAHASGWLVIYIPDCGEWVEVGRTVDKQATYFLSKFAALNERLLRNLEENQYTMPVSRMRPQPKMSEVLVQPLEGKAGAYETQMDIEAQLKSWTATPVLFILDQHNALWSPRALESRDDNVRNYFGRYTNLTTVSGPRVTIVFSGSRHSKFLASTRSISEYVIECYPLSTPEVSALLVHHDFPPGLREDKAEVERLTGWVPGEVARLVARCDDIDELIRNREAEFELEIVRLLEDKDKKYRDKCWRLVRSMFMGYWSDKKKTRSDENLRVAYIDTGAFVYDPVTGWRFACYPARKALLHGLADYWKDLPDEIDAALKNIETGGYDDLGRVGQLFEEAFFQKLLQAKGGPIYLPFADLEGTGKPGSFLNMSFVDVQLLSIREHFPAGRSRDSCLYRCYPKYPVWDFVVCNDRIAFMQESISSISDRMAKKDPSPAFDRDEKWGCY